MTILKNFDLIKHRNEVLRCLRNGRYEQTPDGLYFPSMGANAAGFFDSWVNGKDHVVSPNLVVATGLDFLLQSGFVSTNMYIAPYSNNIAPTSPLTAATAPGTLGEFTNYNESARQQWVKDSESSQSLTNGTTKAVFTISTGGGTIWGAFMGTANTKSATTGTLIAAAQFGAARIVQATDQLTLQYTISLTSS